MIGCFFKVYAILGVVYVSFLGFFSFSYDLDFCFRGFRFFGINEVEVLGFCLYFYTE